MVSTSQWIRFARQNIPSINQALGYLTGLPKFQSAYWSKKYNSHILIIDDYWLYNVRTRLYYKRTRR